MLCLSSSRNELFARDLALIDIAFSGTRLACSLALEWRRDVLVTREIAPLLSEGGVVLCANVVDEAITVAAHRALEFEAAELLDISQAFLVVGNPSRLTESPVQSATVKFENVQLSSSDGQTFVAAKLGDYDHVRFLFSLQSKASQYRALGYAIRSGKAKKLLDLSLTETFALTLASHT